MLLLLQLSVPLGSSLVMAAAMGLASPTMTTYHPCARELPTQHRFAHRLPSLACSMIFRNQSSQRQASWSLQAVSPLQCTEVPMQTSVYFEGFCVSVSTEEDRVMNIQVNVDGTMTDSTFEKIFAKNVAAAQPLPGFRRMKGGKTAEIPKEIALHIIGPSKVRRETIKELVNCTIAEYVQKEGLNASKTLKVQQSFEELEAAFEPGKEFCFEATIHLQ